MGNFSGGNGKCVATPKRNVAPDFRVGTSLLQQSFISAARRRFFFSEALRYAQIELCIGGVFVEAEIHTGIELKIGSEGRLQGGIEVEGIL
jgi:hypothetical protein